MADATDGDTTPTGSVNFFDTATQTDLGQAALAPETDANGNPVPGTALATLTVNGLGPVIGQTAGLSVEANYSGDPDFAANNGPSASVALVNATTTSLQVTSTVAISGQPVTLTASVAVVFPGSAAPTHGTVDFTAYDAAAQRTYTYHNVQLGTILSAAGPSTTPTDSSTAGVSNLILATGTYTVTATYSGDTSSGDRAPSTAAAAPSGNSAHDHYSGGKWQ